MIVCCSQYVKSSATARTLVEVAVREILQERPAIVERRGHR